MFKWDFKEVPMDIHSAVRMTEAGHVSSADLKLPAHLPSQTEEYIEPKHAYSVFAHGKPN